MLTWLWNQYRRRRAPSQKGGFSLIELSVALTITGLLLSTFLDKYKQSEIARVEKKKSSVLFSVADGLSKYLSHQGYYPCPAPLNVASGSSSYGSATDCTDHSTPVGTCAHGYCVTEYPPGSGQRIRIGGLPFKDMRIGKDDIIDAYGNQFTYAVTEKQASPGLYTMGAGAILLKNTDQNGIVTNQIKDMILISHGTNGRGAYSSEGIPNGNACAGPGLDIENCNNDGIFVKYPYSSASGANGFDDQVFTDLWGWVYIWDQTTSDAKSIYNRDVGNMGVGTVTPTEKLDVANGNMRVEGADTQTSMVCKGDGTGCFQPQVLGGSPATGGGMACPAGEILFGIANGTPICATGFGFRNGGCTGDTSFISGFHYTASSQTLTVDCTDAISGSMVVTPVN